MFHTRCPRNADEIRDCIELLKFSPFWSEPGLRDEIMLECWETLLKSGVGQIEITDNPSYHHTLKNEKLARQDPHYKHGFFFTLFIVHITVSFANEIVNAWTHDEEILIQFMRRYSAHLRDPSKPNLALSLGEDGEAPDTLYGLGVGVYHTNANFSPLVVARDASLFNIRMSQNALVVCKGFTYDLFVYQHYSATWLGETIRFGYGVARDYTVTTALGKRQKIYVLCSARNQEVAGRFALPPQCDITKRTLKVNYMMFEVQKPRIANLTKYEQQVCYLLCNGWSPEQIACHIHGSHKSAPAIINRKASASAKLAACEYAPLQSPKPEKSKKGKNLLDQLLKALQKDAAREIREFMFALYPWPDDLDSRPD